MTGRDAKVRDLLPIERISGARIREAIRACSPLAWWSGAEAGAIRPTLLARLVRDGLWEALDVDLGAVQDALVAPGADGRVNFGLMLEVETRPDESVKLPLVASFALCGSGRAALTISLNSGGRDYELVRNRVLLVAEP